MKRIKSVGALVVALVLTLAMPLSVFADTHTVKSGDELWKIAQEYNVSVEDLAKANAISNSNLIMPGQVLNIPGDGMASQAQAQGQVKNVIVLIGDGMGFGQMELARLMEYGPKGKLHMEAIENTAFVKTNSYDNIVTDSGAAGTAIATGVKTINKAIGVDENGVEVDSMADYFKDMGKSIGIISTNTVYDATPAAFGASATNRGDKGEIVRDMLEENWDVILGGGSKYFGPKKQDGEDYIEKFKSAGYTYVETQSELNSVQNADKLLGLFSYDYMSYKADREEINSTEPSLKDMTKVALDVLAKDQDGFFLMSEGARIDHAAHAADGTGVWKELIEFDEMVKYCMEWVEGRDDTLLIVTADHETMAVGASEALNIQALKAVEVSPEYMASKLVKTEDETMYTLDSIKSVYKEYANIELTDEEAKELQEIVTVDLYAYKAGWEMGSVIAKKFGVAAMDPELRKYGVTGGHTAAWVPLFATGTGAESFDGVLDNIEIFPMIQNIVK